MEAVEDRGSHANASTALNAEGPETRVDGSNGSHSVALEETAEGSVETKQATACASIDTVALDPDRTVDFAAGTDCRSMPTIAFESHEQETRDLDDPRGERPRWARPSTGKPETWDRVPGYEIIDVLGSGGMGVVYKARDLNLNRLVALKMIRNDRKLTSEDLARFWIEAMSVARPRHANIVQIYHIGQVGPVPYLSLELLEGGSLAKRLGGMPQPFRDAAAMVATLARAVRAAHLAGIIHRDLKPSNVLFDIGGTPKISDFGLAKRLEVEDGETVFGQVMGTPSYMPLEQAQGKTNEIGPAADIYALGAMLYEMLTGRPPFKGMTTAETLSQVLTEEIIAPSRLRAKIPFDLETICLKCLEREPRKRYADAAALADDLDRFLNGRTILARRTPAWERAIKLAKRRPATTLVLALGLALSVAAGVVWRDSQIRAVEHARTEEDRLAGLRREVDAKLFDAQKALDERQWAEVSVITSKELERIGAERRLDDLRGRAEDLLAKARRGLADQRASEQVRARLKTFRTALDEANFLDTRFTGFGINSTPEAACRAAGDALRVFGVAADGDDWTLSPLPESMNPREREEVEAGFYESLLILADGVAHRPGAGPKQRAKEALKVLDRAAPMRRSASRGYHLRRSSYLATTGESRSAEQERAQAEREAPVDAFDFFLNGHERLKRSELSAAIADFDAVLQRKPDHFWAQCLLAICHLQNQQPLRAKPSLNACLQQRGDTVWLYLLRGIAGAQAGNKALELAGNYPDQAKALNAEAAAQFDAAETDYAKALGLLDRNPEGTDLRYTLHVNRGLIRFERNDLIGAEADLREAIRLDDRHFEAFSALAHVERKRDRINDALEHFDRAIALKPLWPPLYRGRAGVILGLKEISPERRDAALNDLQAAICYDSAGSPFVALDYLHQASLLHGAGRDADALKACEAAIDVAPKNADAHLMRLELLIGLQRYDDLIGSCDVVLNTLKPIARIHELRGMAHDALKQHAKAAEDYTLALSLAPKQPELLALRGWSYLMTDSPRLALEDFDAAISVNPKPANGYNGRGFAKARLRRFREAVKDAEAALERGKDARTASNAARVYVLAANAAIDDSRRVGPDVARLVEVYHQRALDLIVEYLKRLPSDQRAAAMRDKIQTDPVFQPIRKRLRTVDPALKAALDDR